jgi:hypothetical protein
MIINNIINILKDYRYEYDTVDEIPMVLKDDVLDSINDIMMFYYDIFGWTFKLEHCQIKKKYNSFFF